MPSGPSALAAPPFLDHLARDSPASGPCSPAPRRACGCRPAPTGMPTTSSGTSPRCSGSGARSPQRAPDDPAEVDALDERRVDAPSRSGRPARALRPVEQPAPPRLAALDPATELWMWADEHTAGYIARRQAHEALIHRLDAELTVGARTPLDCRLAADGVDEALRIMRGYEPEPGLTHEALGGSVTIAIVDAMHAWTVTPVRVTGSYEGEEIDLQRLLVADGPDDGSAAEICGSAADLDCWLWNRPAVDEITREGDAAALGAVEAVLTDSID